MLATLAPLFARVGGGGSALGFLFIAVAIVAAALILRNKAGS